MTGVGKARKVFYDTIHVRLLHYDTSHTANGQLST